MKRLAFWRWLAILIVATGFAFSAPVRAIDVGAVTSSGAGLEVAINNQLTDSSEAEDVDYDNENPDSLPPEVEPYLAQFGDLKLIKIQLRDKNHPAADLVNSQELVVIKNTTIEVINLKGWRLEIVDKNLAKKAEVAIQKDLFLEPNGLVYFVNDYLEANGLADIDPELVFSFGKVKAGKLPKSFGSVRLLSADKTEIVNTSYSNQNQSDAIYLASDKDFASWVVYESGELVKDEDGQPIFEQFMARQSELIIWLPIDALPIQESPIEPDPDTPPIVDEDEEPEPIIKVCAEGYEVGFTGTCVKICGVGYERNSDTNRCRKIIEIEDEPKPCQVGYERNPETGRCRKIVVDVEPAPCPVGSYRNPTTGRCNKINLTSSAALAPCPVGYERNPETNRCRKISNQQECNNGYEIGFTGSCVKACADGYQRNAETNRCRKLVAMASAEDIEGAVLAAGDSDAPNVVKLEWYHAAIVVSGGMALIGFSKRKALVDFFKNKLSK